MVTRRVLNETCSGGAFDRQFVFFTKVFVNGLRRSSCRSEEHPQWLPLVGALHHDVSSGKPIGVFDVKTSIYEVVSADIVVIVDDAMLQPASLLVVDG